MWNSGRVMYKVINVVFTHCVERSDFMMHIYLPSLHICLKGSMTKQGAHVPFPGFLLQIILYYLWFPSDNRHSYLDWRRVDDTDT